MNGPGPGPQRNGYGPPSPGARYEGLAAREPNSNAQSARVCQTSVLSCLLAAYCLMPGRGRYKISPEAIRPVRASGCSRAIAREYGMDSCLVTAAPAARPHLTGREAAHARPALSDLSNARMARDNVITSAASGRAAQSPQPAATTSRPAPLFTAARAGTGHG